MDRAFAWEAVFVLPPNRKRNLPPSHAARVYNMGTVKGDGRWEAGWCQAGGSVSQGSEHKLSHSIWGSGAGPVIDGFRFVFCWASFLEWSGLVPSARLRTSITRIRSRREPGPPADRSRRSDLRVRSDRATPHELRKTPISNPGPGVRVS